MIQQRSESQKAASRANGAKSRGPRTLDGVERCRHAATLHGMYTPQILLANEDPTKYKRLLTAYIAEWNPLGITERDLLTDMVNARWRIRRLWGQTAGLVNAEMLFSQDRTDASYQPVTAELRQCDGICELEKALPGLLGRMQTSESSLKRIYSRSKKELLELQTMRLGTRPTLVPQPAEDEIFFPPPEAEPCAHGTPPAHEPPGPSDPAAPSEALTEPAESTPSADSAPAPDAGPQPDLTGLTYEGNQAVCQNPEVFHPCARYFSYDDDGELRPNIYAKHLQRDTKPQEDFPTDLAA